MKPKKIVILIGAFYDGILEILESRDFEYKIILHKNNPEIVNNSFLKSEFTPLVNVIENNEEMMEILKVFSPKIIISMGWRKILKKDFFDTFNDIHLINIHPAILPDYKGFHTEPYIIINNEKEHGITAHLLTEELDAGDIILQKRFPINEFSTVRSIKQEVRNIMPTFFAQLLNLLASRKLSSIAQSGETKMIAPKRSVEDSQINKHESIENLYNSIRACDPDLYPAFFYHNNEKIYIKIWTNRIGKKNFEI